MSLPVKRRLAALEAGLAALKISDLADVTIANIESGEVLKWNGTAWVNDTDETSA